MRALAALGREVPLALLVGRSVQVRLHAMMHTVLYAAVWIAHHHILRTYTHRKPPPPPVHTTAGLRTFYHL